MTLVRTAFVLLAIAAVFPGRAEADDRLCDAAFENCRTQLLEWINNETVGIDVAFWFMEDTRYSNALIAKFNAGVPVRIIVDPRANAAYPFNAVVLDLLADAGIPMRKKTSSGIVHWKTMIFAGQGKVQFSGANYSPHAFRPEVPYENYIDEVIYFTEDAALVNSFKRKFDDVWTTTSGYSTYANAIALQRHYPLYSIDSRMNFVPTQNFRSRSVPRYRAETEGIDATMFRITDRAHTDALIERMNAGVPVRLLTDRREYRDPSRLWHAWNVDRLHAAGAKVRINNHDGDLHQKSTILHGQRMVIFGSSNWTSPSASSQLEHNIFTSAAWFYDWFVDQFDRKWNNRTGHLETTAFVPLPPDRPLLRAPANGAAGISTSSVTLSWYAGPWAHVYDIYVGTSSNPPLFASNLELGPSDGSSDLVRYTVQNLQPGATYFWRIVSKTMAGVSRSGEETWSFRTGGEPAPLPSGWQSRDIGNVGVAGSASYDNGTFIVNGAGADIWGSSDALHFAYRSLSGDGTIVARVASLSGSESWTKVGVMVRGSTSSGAAQAMMLVSKAKGLAFQRRTSDGGSSLHTSGGSGTAPRWVRLVRSGNTITASVSGNGSTWSTVGSDTFSMPSTALFGIAVSSHSTSQLASGVFDSVSVTSGGTPPPTPEPLPSGWTSRDIGSVGVDGDASYEDGVFTVRGAGDDVWGTSDAFHYAYRSLTGDGSIVARIASISGSEAWTKIGVMMRASTASNAAYAFMLGSISKGFAFQRRRSAGGSATHTSGGSGTAPRWVALTRSGDTITAHISSSGSTWTTVGSDTFDMPSTILVGLAAHSHTTSRLATGMFDNVSVDSGSVTTNELPAGWQSDDIGAVGVAGTAFAENGTFTVTGAGEDVWGTADAFHYAHRELSGDGQIVAHVASIEGDEAWTKVGVMIRDSAEADASYAFMLVSEDKGLAFQRRTAEGVEATHTAAGDGTAPAWLRLERTGNVIAAYVSPDGSSWNHVASDAFAMTPDVLVGLATSSHDSSETATGTFDHVEVEGS